MAAKKRTEGVPVQDWLDEEESRAPGFIADIDAANLRERVAKDLKALREAAGLTQAQLAQRLGIKQPVVAKVESGNTMPDLMTVHRFAHALGYLVDPPSYRPMPGRSVATPSGERPTKITMVEHLRAQLAHLEGAASRLKEQIERGLRAGARRDRTARSRGRTPSAPGRKHQPGSAPS